MAFGATLVTDLVAPLPRGGSAPIDVVLKRQETQKVVASFSAMTLYSEATRDHSGSLAQDHALAGTHGAAGEAP
jgi:hypothetical protein